jgi:hypothetical protein
MSRLFLSKISNQHGGVMAIELKWEVIESNGGTTQRAKVRGGWLVAMYEGVAHDMRDTGQGFEHGWDWRPALTFVPDPNHEWGNDGNQ